MYFENFPVLYYTVDDNRTGQIVQDIFRRVAISEELVNTTVLYELYEVQDGDTPEILADRFYDDPGLFWVILITNNILDPRFGWPMDQYRLEKYVERKYPSNLYVQGNVVVNFNLGEVVSTSSGASARVLFADGNKLSVINVQGTFSNGETLTGSVSEYSANLINSGTHYENTPEQTAYYAYVANSIVVDSTTASQYPAAIEEVSNRINEIRLNDNKRKIKILKSEYVSRLVAEFKRAINT